MTGKFKTGMRALSVLLTVVILIGILPMSVFAEKVNDYEATRSINGALEADEKAEIVSELPLKRDEYTKVFLRTDGTQTAIISGAPLHYEKDGKWENIDNTLEKKTVDGESVLQNKAGAFTVSLPCELKDSSAVAVENKGYTLSFALQSEELTSKSSVKAQMEYKRAEKAVAAAQSSDAYAAVGFEDKESAVVFESVEKDTDIQYIVTPTGLKENIILNKKPQSGVSYAYEISVDGLTGVLNEDNSIDFKDANGEVIFNLPAPFMFDANDEQTYDVEVTLTGSGSTYIMTYTPSYEWLSDGKRKYPVTVDPVVQTPVGESKIEDSMIYAQEPSENYGDALLGMIGQESGDYCRMYYKLSNNILFNLESVNVINAKFHVGVLPLNNMIISANPVSNFWTENVITYNYMLNLNDISLSSGIDTLLYDYAVTKATEDKIISFNITEAFFGIDNINDFYGIMLKDYNENQGNAAFIFNSEYTLDASLCPVFEITYKTVNNMDGVCDSFALPAGRAGTMYMNHFSTDVFINNEIIGINGQKAPVFIDFNYNSVAYNRFIKPSEEIQQCYGKGWLTSYNQFIGFGTELGDVVEYCNEYGDVINLILSSEDNNYYIYSDLEDIDSSGLKMYVYKSISNNCIAFIEKDDGTKLYFDLSLRLVKIEDEKENSVIIEYENEGVFFIGDLFIKKITDGAGREYRFIYNDNNKLISITCYNNIMGQGYVQTTVPHEGGNVPLSRGFAYDTGGYLTGISYPDGKAVKYSYSASSPPSVQMRNIDGYTLKYYIDTEDDSRMISERYYETPTSTSYTLGNTVTVIKSEHFYRVFEYRYGENVYKQLDKYGSTVCTTDGTGESAYLSYTGDNNYGSMESDLVGPAGLTYISGGTNLVQNGDFENGTNDWILALSNSTTDVYSLSIGDRINTLGTNALNIRGSINDSQSVFQLITPQEEGKAGDGYSFSAWALSKSALPEKDYYKAFNITIWAYITDESSENYQDFINVAKLSFNPYLTCWQGVRTYFQINEKYSNIFIQITYNNQLCPEGEGVNYQTHTASFDGIELIKISSGESIGSSSGGGEIPEIPEPEIEFTEENGTKIFSLSNDGTKMSMSKTISENYLSDMMDFNGIYTSYNYNQGNGLLNSITDGTNNTITYAYNSMGDLTQVSQYVSGLSGPQILMKTQYGYTNDRLTSITHNGLTYNLEYDIWGKQTAVKLGSQVLVSYTYGTGLSSDRLNAITYANGDTINYTYNIDGTVAEVKKHSSSKSSYEYDYTNGILSSVTDNESGMSTVYTDEGLEIYSGSNLVFSSYFQINENAQTVTTESFVGKTYTLTQSDEVSDIDTGKTTSTSTLTGYGGKDIELSAVSDYFGRKIQSDIRRTLEEEQGYKVDLNLRESYSYKTLDGTNNITSGLVEKYSFDVGALIDITDPTLLEDSELISYDGVFMKYSGTDFCYEYDGKGNIIREYTLNENEDEVSRYDYTYDEAGQLTRADDAVQSKSFTYTYDIGGNIVSKKEYDYTTGMLGTVIDTKNYTYDTVWKDKLASYDGNVINYDQMGNPMNYISKDVSENDVAGMLEYDGRQLVKATNISENCEYVYNENGLMSKKLVYNNYDIDSNGKIIFFDLQSTYTYYWNDSKLMGYTLVNSSDGSFFNVKVIYGADGEPLGYTITGDNDFEMGFVYTKNLQGDITGIYTLEGTSCLLFSYDAYGIPTYTVGDSFIGAWLSLVLNPFLYRGYMYDINTGLYYLQSRYYNPIYGRFLNADETGILQVAQGEVHGANLFAYCNNNPIRFIDTSGRVALLVIIKIIIEIVVVLEILNFFFSAHSFYKEILETMRIHTRNVLAVGIEKNYNVNLQVFGYFSKKNYARHCLESYETLKFYTDILGITNSYTKDDVEALKATMIGWDRYVFYNIIKFYLKKLIFFGYVTIFTDFTL